MGLRNWSPAKVGVGAVACCRWQRHHRAAKKEKGKERKERLIGGTRIAARGRERERACGWLSSVASDTVRGKGVERGRERPSSALSGPRWWAVLRARSDTKRVSAEQADAREEKEGRGGMSWAAELARPGRGGRRGWAVPGLG